MSVQSASRPLFDRQLMTCTGDMARAFDDDHETILEKCGCLRDMDLSFFDKHFTLLSKNSGKSPTKIEYHLSLAGFLVLANMMEEPEYQSYLKEIQSVCIDLDIILRGPMKSVRELAWEVPLEDMAESIKANLAPLLGKELSDRQLRRRDFAFALIDRLSP